MSVFKLALPGFDVHRARAGELVLSNLMDSPKIDTQATPPHAGIIFLNWQTTTAIPFDTTKIITSFPHNLKRIPQVIGSYRFDNGFNTLKGTFPFQLGALGILTMDADEININLKYYSIDGASTAIPVFTMQARFYVIAAPGY